MPNIPKAKQSKGLDGGNISSTCELPLLALTDSYKLSHQLMYPLNRDVGYGIKRMVAYGECRGPLKINGKPIIYNYKNKSIPELRLINFGLRYIIENYINKKIDKDMIEKIQVFYKTHGFLNSSYPYNENVMEKLKVGMYPPIRIYGLKEGTVMLPRTPVYVIEAEEDFAQFVTYFETILTMIWYPISVATLSKCCKDIFQRKYNEIGANYFDWFVNFSLHDFGFRGTSSVETSTIGGMAHLLNFSGTDTLSAAVYAQYVYNGGKPVGQSIAASEHSVMTSFKKEVDAFYQIIKNFGGGIEKDRDHDNIPKAPFAVVMDSYDYENALINVFSPAIRKYIDNDRKHINTIQNIHHLDKNNLINFFKNNVKHIYINRAFQNEIDLTQLYKLDAGIFSNNGTTVFTINDMNKLPSGFCFTFRPDSGNPYVAVIQSLIAGLKMFGIDEQGSFYGKHPDYQKKQILYIKPKFVRTLQGDGINIFTIQYILDVITDPRYVSTNGNWAFSPFSLLCGMGGGLLQKVNRDTVNFATKLCYVEYDDKTEKIVMKSPETAPDKKSLPGKPFVIKENGILMSKPHNDHIDLINKLKNKKQNAHPFIIKKGLIRGGENIDTKYGDELVLYYDGISQDTISSPYNSNDIYNKAKYNIENMKEYDKIDNNYIDILKQHITNEWKNTEKYRDLKEFEKQGNKFSAISKELYEFQNLIDKQMKSGYQKEKAQYTGDKKYPSKENLDCLYKSPFIKYVFSQDKNEIDNILPTKGLVMKVNNGNFNQYIDKRYKTVFSDSK